MNPQDYPQQSYPPAQGKYTVPGVSSGEARPPPPPKHYVAWGMFFLVLIGAIALFFLMKPRMDLFQNNPSIPEQELPANNALLGPSIEQEKDVEVAVDLSSFSKPIRDETRVYGPDGREISELYAKDSFSYDSPDLSNLKLTLQIPERYPEGEYKVRVRFYDDANHEVIKEEKIKEIDEITIRGAAFGLNVLDSFGKPIPNVGAIYVSGDIIKLSFSVNDFGQRKTNEGYKINFLLNSQVLDGVGNVLPYLDKKNISYIDETKPELSSLYDLVLTIPTQNLQSGDYVLVIEAKDIITGDSMRKSLDFSIE